MSDDELIQKIARHMPHRLFYILEALKRGFEFEELLDLSKLAPIYLQVLANLVEMEKVVEAEIKPAFLPVEPSAGLYEVKEGSSLLSDPKWNQWIVRFGRCLCLGGWSRNRWWAFLPKGEKASERARKKKDNRWSYSRIVLLQNLWQIKSIIFLLMRQAFTWFRPLIRSKILSSFLIYNKGSGQSIRILRLKIKIIF